MKIHVLTILLSVAASLLLFTYFHLLILLSTAMTIHPLELTGYPLELTVYPVELGTAHPLN
jgi:hypothetical protein